MGKPEKVFQHGSCKAAIFNNTINSNGKAFTMPKIVVNKSFREKFGDWKNTDSYDLNDLPKLMVAVSKAYQFLTEKNNGEA